MKYTVLVTGVGAIIGYGIIKCLRNSKFNLTIIGIDIYDDAIGGNWVDHFEKGILASDPNFPHFLKSLIQQYKVDLVIPGIEQDIESIVLNYGYLENDAVSYVINNTELVLLSKDKWETNVYLKKHNVDTIKTYIDGEFLEIKNDLGIPFLLKPRRSYASKGIQRIYNVHDFNYWKKKLGENFMVQEIIGDDDHEYTVSVFGLGNGEYCDVIMLNRKLALDGSTVKANLFYDIELERYIKGICEITRPIGPTNFQVRLHNNKYYLLEINPRISSSTSIREAFGYNESEMCIEYYLEKKIPIKRKIKEGKAIRFIEDYIIYDCNHS